MSMVYYSETKWTNQNQKIWCSKFWLIRLSTKVLYLSRSFTQTNCSVQNSNFWVSQRSVEAQAKQKQSSSVMNKLIKRISHFSLCFPELLKLFKMFKLFIWSTPWKSCQSWAVFWLFWAAKVSIKVRFWAENDLQPSQSSLGVRIYDHWIQHYCF